MNQSKVLVIIFLVLLLLGGGIFVWQKERTPAPVSVVPTEPLAPAPVTPSETPIDTSNWKTYRNEKIGFSFNYPSNWGLEEKNIKADWSETHPDWVFRYVVLQTSDFVIEIGLKDIQEGEKIKLLSWRTGVPAGEFKSGGLVKVSQGVSDKHYLIDINDRGKVVTKMILYCEPDTNINSCEPFSLGSNKVGLAGIFSVKESENDPWQEIEKEFQQVMATFKVF